MDFVTPWLAIGAAGEAADAALRRAHGIDAVLSLLPVDFDAGAAHLTLPVADRVALPASTIRTVTAYIERQRQAGRKTLLHCQMGISRSPALAACYLHEYAGWRLDDALHEVGQARPVADPHPALLASMRQHYDEDGCRSDGLDIDVDSATLPASHLDLSANENPLGPSPLALAALAAALVTSHRYPDRAATALRNALAARHGGSAEQIVLGNGSCEVLDLAARALLAPGQAAIIAPPCFPAYRSAVKRAHGRLVEVPLRADEAFAYRLDRIGAAIADDTRLIVIGNPNNPTGQGVEAADFGDWLDDLPPHVTVLLDEAYRDYGDAQPLADGPALVRGGRRLLVVRSFSKLHGLAGLRLGYAFGPADLIAKLDAQRPTYNANTPAQVAALAALNDQAHQRSSRQLNAAGLEQLRNGLAALGLNCPPGQGNFVLADFGACGLDAGQIARQLAGTGIDVKPGSAFGLPTYLRISVGLPAQNQRLLEALQKILINAARHS